MKTPIAHTTDPLPTTGADCGHARHLGSCPSCQRAALIAARRQLAAAIDAGRAWAARPRPGSETIGPCSLITTKGVADAQLT